MSNSATTGVGQHAEQVALIDVNLPLLDGLALVCRLLSVASLGGVVRILCSVDDFGRLLALAPGDANRGEGETHAYPMPLSDAFWEAYGEPIEEMLGAAVLFSETLQDLEPKRLEGETALDWAPRTARADQAFFSLIAGVHPGFGVDPDLRLERAWWAKSLLASFAMMAYLDITDGMRVLSCEVCEKPFVSSAYQARYCSARCRNTAVKRAYRGRLRERDAAYSPPADGDDGGTGGEPARDQEG